MLAWTLAAAGVSPQDKSQLRRQLTTRNRGYLRPRRQPGRDLQRQQRLATTTTTRDNNNNSQQQQLLSMMVMSTSDG